MKKIANTVAFALRTDRSLRMMSLHRAAGRRPRARIFQGLLPIVAVLLAQGFSGCSSSTPPAGGGEPVASLSSAVIAVRPLADFVGIATGTFKGDVGVSSEAEQVALLERIRGMGIHRVRVDFTWSVVEPHRGVWNWGGYDAFVKNANAWNVEILGILDYGAAWANSNVYPPNGDPQAPPDYFQDFLDYARAVVLRYQSSVHAYEIWNEPNNGHNFWHSAGNDGTGAVPPVDRAPRDTGTLTFGDPGLYGQLAATTITMIRSLGLGASTPLLAPGGTIYNSSVINNTGPIFMETALAAGANHAKAQNEPTLGKMTDAITLHPYTNYPPLSPPESDAQAPSDQTQDDKVARMALAFQDNGTPAIGTPKWITEVGWPNKNGVTEDMQARWLVREVMLAALEGIDLVYLYNMYDSQPNTDATETCGPVEEAACVLSKGPNACCPEAWFGLSRVDGTVKQSYLALEYLMETVGSYHFTQFVFAPGSPSTVNIAQLADLEGDQAWVAWDANEAGSNFKWQLPPNTKCTDIYRNPCQLSGGMLTLTARPAIIVQVLPPPPPPNEKVAACNRIGDPMDVQSGIHAYCDNADESGKFQCDQYANRFMSSLNLPPVDNWVSNLACEICGLVADDPKLSALYSVWGPGYRAPAGHKPAPNDLLVWTEVFGCSEQDPGDPGHAAVVTSVSPQSIQYIQQNWMLSDKVNGSAYSGLVRATTTWDSAASFFGSPTEPDGTPATFLQPTCWVHPECPPGAKCNPGTAANPCRAVTSANNGLYCGMSPQAGFSASTVNKLTDPNTVYECFDGQVANETHCTTGCYIAGAGMPDGCIIGSRDPCNGVAGSENGLYCGRSTQFGFDANHTADAQQLYDCVNGHAASVVSCKDGCYIAGGGVIGVPDGCVQDPCGGVSGASSGLYCGSSTQPGFGTNAWTNTVYDCEGGVSVASAMCAAGCIVEMSGKADRCVQDPCADVASADDGLYCNSSTQARFDDMKAKTGMAGAMPDTLYYCKGGRSVWSEHCFRGCFVAPEGQSDGCN
jgi:Cellulase (glycosyl hydrolase family 5)